MIINNFHSNYYIPKEIEDNILNHLDLCTLKCLELTNKSWKCRIRQISRYNIAINNLFKLKISNYQNYPEEIINACGGARDFFFVPLIKPPLSEYYNESLSEAFGYSRFELPAPITRGSYTRGAYSWKPGWYKRGLYYRTKVGYIALKVQCYLKKEYVDNPFCKSTKLALIVDNSSQFIICHNIENTKLYKNHFYCGESCKKKHIECISKLIKEKIISTKESEWIDLIGRKRLSHTLFTIDNQDKITTRVSLIFLELFGEDPFGDRELILVLDEEG